MMFEAAEVGRKVRKAEFQKRIPRLRVCLVNAQYDLRDREFPVIIVLAGNDRPGCNEVLHGLHEVMDGRYIETNALGLPTEEERERPRFWRYWRCLPRRGKIGAFLGGWPIDVIVDHLTGVIDAARLEREIEHITHFEETLAADGALLLKFWLHLPKEKLKRRIKQAKKDPGRWWQIDDRDRRLYKRYDDVLPIAERVLRETSTREASWQIIESTDNRYRNLRVADTLLAALEKRLATPLGPRRPAPRIRRAPARRRQRTILDTIDLSQSLPRAAYRKQLDRQQAQVRGLARKARAKGVSSILVFEGWDAAGKGGVIRRITAAMNLENYHLVPIGAPTEEELAHHYLWRFWRHLPRAGCVTIFDRSWYGRVLVERVERLASEDEWRRAYSEINDFEAQLSAHGVTVLKFWLHIDPDEQLRRFRARQQTAYKKFKITDEDFRNRERWREYEVAVHEMVGRTSTAHAPWHLVPSNDKRFARVHVLKTYARALKARL